MEFMVLRLMDIVMELLRFSFVYLLFLLVSVVIVWIVGIIGKGGGRHGKSK